MRKSSRILVAIVLVGLLLVMLAVPVVRFGLVRVSVRTETIMVSEDAAFLHALQGEDELTLAAVAKDPGVLTRRNLYGETLLHEAAAKCSADTVAELLRLGADPLARVSFRSHQNFGFMPFHYALGKERPEIVRKFLEYPSVRSEIERQLADVDSVLNNYGWAEAARALMTTPATAEAEGKE